MSIIFIFLTILVLELVLSVDNASVLAVTVNSRLDDEDERKKALQYGIVGAYVFRGLSLLLVGWIIHNPTFGAIFKIIGGVYLVWLWYDHIKSSSPDGDVEQEPNWMDRALASIGINTFWATVIIVEIMDIVFSIDNLVAVVSMTENMTVIIVAVFLGILGMRFIAGKFSEWLVTYPSLESSAFFVILLLGLKLTIAGGFDFYPETWLHEVLNAESTDFIFSIITLSVFGVPVIYNKYFKN